MRLFYFQFLPLSDFLQAATLAIKKKYGKNAILKAMNLEEGATAKDRNAQIGGHKAYRIKQKKNFRR